MTGGLEPSSPGSNPGSPIGVNGNVVIGRLSVGLWRYHIKNNAVMSFPA